jgi:hypothetical protein
MATDIDLEIAGLRARRASPRFADWLRTLRPFDRRSIREPGSRDAYWANVQRRLAVSDARSLIAARATEPPDLPE